MPTYQVVAMKAHVIIFVLWHERTMTVNFSWRMVYLLSVLNCYNVYKQVCSQPRTDVGKCPPLGLEKNVMCRQYLNIYTDVQSAWF